MTSVCPVCGAAQPPAAPVEKRPPGAGPAGATFGGFEPLSPPQSCSAGKESARELGETIVAETERLLELEAAFFVSLVSNGLPADVGELLTHGSARQGIPPRLIQKAIKASIPLNVERERDEARQLVIEANNSLYGSQGYFHSLNGGAFDTYHLSRGIEDLKARLRAEPQSSGVWQPIETAPKDGTWIIGICNDHSRLYRMSWGLARDGHMAWCTADGVVTYGDGLFSPFGGWASCPVSRPQHSIEEKSND